MAKKHDDGPAISPEYRERLRKHTEALAHDDDTQDHDEADGQLDATMRQLLGRSWRTTCFGLLAGAVGVGAAVLPFVPGAPSWLVEAVKVGAPILVGGGFLVAKDAKVTGLPKR